MERYTPGNFGEKHHLKVFWMVLMERSIQQNAVLSLMDVAGVAALMGAKRIHMEYQRTDMARNNAVKAFLKHSTGEDDVLVMLDADHVHPRNIIPALADKCDAEHEVVGALAFRRSLPHDPCFYVLDENEKADVPTQFTGGLVKCDIVGTGAIAIRRSVFAKLDAAGHLWPYFYYSYKAGEDIQRSEDWQFGLNCKAAGIPHWVNQDSVTPHLTVKAIDEQDWFEVLRRGAENPEQFARDFAPLGMTITKEG